MIFLAIFLVVFIAIVLVSGASMLCALGQMDVANPKVPAATAVVMAIFGFPFMDFWSLLGGDQLKKILGDGCVMVLFIFLDATIWSVVSPG